MSKIATRDAYGKALLKLGEINEDIVVLDADLSKSTKTAGFAKAFPERFINAGIAEQNLMGMAAGVALTGKIVFASTFAVFATGRAFEQIRNSIAYAKLNVKICATHAGVSVGEDGGSHQSIEDISIMRSIPNMKVVVPSDGVLTEKAIFALAQDKGPVYVRLGRPALATIYNDEQEFELGKGIELRLGNDATIVACGLMVEKALRAAERLAEEGINISVVDMHTIKPIDIELLKRKAQETGAILCAEEHSIIGGLGSAVCEVLSEHCPVPVLRLGVMDEFGQSGKPDELLEHYGLSVENIIAKTRVLLMMKT